jgi:protein phosphatase
MPLIATIDGATEMGWSRRHSEDRLVVASDQRLCAVLDGCGGNGLPAELVATSLASLLSTREGPITLGAIEDAIRLGEARLLTTVHGNPRLRGCGTTLLLAFLSGPRLTALHVGDGRLYRIRAGTLTQLSSDHTWIAEMVASGQLTPEEAQSHPLKNVVTRAIGGSVRAPLDHIEETVTPDDLFILCTDGLWREVSNDRIREAFLTMPPQEAARHLLRVPGLPRPDRQARCDDATIAVISIAGSAAV